MFLSGVCVIPFNARSLELSRMPTKVTTGDEDDFIWSHQRVSGLERIHRSLPETRRVLSSERHRGWK